MSRFTTRKCPSHNPSTAGHWAPPELPGLRFKDALVQERKRRRGRTLVIILVAAVKSADTDAVAAKIKAVFNNAFSVHVDHFVRLDFQVFVQAVDAVGGIEVEFTQPLLDTHFENRDRGQPG